MFSMCALILENLFEQMLQKRRSFSAGISSLLVSVFVFSAEKSLEDARESRTLKKWLAFIYKKVSKTHGSSSDLEISGWCVSVPSFLSRNSSGSVLMIDTRGSVEISPFDISFLE